MEKWEHELTAVDGKAMLFGVNIFDYEWIATGRRADVTDPVYGQKYSFPVYKVSIEGRELEFAADEFSNCVFGFYAKK